MWRSSNLDLEQQAQEAEEKEEELRDSLFIDFYMHSRWYREWTDFTKKLFDHMYVNKKWDRDKFPDFKKETVDPLLKITEAWDA